MRLTRTNLVGDRLDGASLHEALELLLVEVGDADAPGQAQRHAALHAPPGVHVVHVAEADRAVGVAHAETVTVGLAGDSRGLLFRKTGARFPFGALKRPLERFSGSRGRLGSCNRLGGSQAHLEARGPVDQVQVEVVEAQVPQRQLTGVNDAARVVKGVPQLRMKGEAYQHPRGRRRLLNRSPISPEETQLPAKNQ